MEIYIVEDDMSVISVLQDIIEDNDLGIVCGTSEGQPADVDDILAKNPDMVLIDFLMPERTVFRSCVSCGKEAARQNAS